MTATLRLRGGWMLVMAIALTSPQIVCAQGGAGPQDAATKKFLAANGLYQRQLYKLAAEQYEEFLKENPGHAEATTARYALAVCRFRLSEFDKAAAGLEQALKDANFKQGEDALFMLGHAYLGAKDYPKSLGAFDRLIEKYPPGNRAEAAKLNRAQVLYLMGRNADAATACEGYLKDYPKSDQRGEALYFLGLSQHAAGKDAQAIAAFSEMVKAAPNSPRRWDAVLMLGQLLEDAKRLDEAAAEYQRMIDSGDADRQAEGLLSLAMLQYRRGSYDDSIKTLTKLLAAQPAGANGGTARLQLGLAQLAAGKTADARQTLAEVIKSDSARSGTARYWLSQCDIVDKKFDSALRQLDELIRSGAAASNADRIAIDRAQCLMGLNRFAEAADAYAAFIDKYPAHAQVTEASYYEAFCLHKAEKYDKSEAICRKLIGPDGGSFAGPAKELLGENLFLLAQYDEAAKIFEALLPGAADKLRFTVRLGQCAYFSGKMDKAIELLGPLSTDNKLIDNRELSRALLLLGDALLQSGKAGDAATVLARYVEVAQADKPEARFKLALALIRSGKAVEGERLLRQVMSGPADSSWTIRATFEFGQLAYRQKEPAKAAEALKSAAAAKGYADLSAAAEYLLAWIEFDARHFEQAAGQFAAMNRKYPKDALAADALFCAGVAWREAGSDEKAAATLDKYLAANPAGANAPKAKQLIAACLVKLQKHEEAVRALSALANDPKTISDEVLFDLAWSQQAMKQTDEAQRTYLRLIAAYPKSKLAASARSELGELLYQQGKYQEGAVILKAVVEDKSTEAKTVSVALYRLGSCYEKLNQPAKATQMYTDFLASHKDDELAAWAHYQAGVNLARQKNWTEARKHFEAALAGKSQGELAAVSTLKLGEVLAELREFESSEKLYRQFIERFPGDKLSAQAQFGIGWAMENERKYEEARQWYEKVIAATNSEIAARAQFQVGETWFAQGRHEKAVVALLAVADVYGYPQWSARALLEAGRAFELLKQPKEAAQQYEQVIGKYRDTAEAAIARKLLDAMRK